MCPNIRTKHSCGHYTRTEILSFCDRARPREAEDGGRRFDCCETFGQEGDPHAEIIDCPACCNSGCCERATEAAQERLNLIRRELRNLSARMRMLPDEDPARPGLLKSIIALQAEMGEKLRIITDHRGCPPIRAVFGLRE